jgi:hypothetical protein
MADFIAIILLAILFPLSVFYVAGCDRLKGSRR